MIFYKFKDDDKGELNELCIAARFPNTVPKRVIIRLSVPEEVKRIEALDEDVSLRMIALLLLGLSNLLQRKTQLLLADCLRFQSELVEVKSLDKKDIDLLLTSSNEQQINLSKTSNTLDNYDLDISIDQGALVDEWVNNNFADRSLLADSFTTSSASSLSGPNAEVDMLRRYTQQTLLDDLLPPQSSLISQELEIESRRGADPNLNLSLLRPSTVSESMEVELGPLSPDDSFESATNPPFRLKPIEKTPTNRKRRRQLIPIDQSLELPKQGMIIRGSELKDMLSRARSKRQKLNHSQLFLLDMENENGSILYGDSLQQLLNVKLVIGKKSMTILDSEIQHEVPSDSIDMFSVDDVTLNISDHSINEPIQERDSTVEYDLFVKSVKERIQTELMENGNRTISWESYSSTDDRRTAALNFQHLLESAGKRDLAVSQERPYGDILVSLPM